MKRPIVMTLLAAVAVLLVGVAVLSGAIRVPGSSDDAHPPCDQLPQQEQAAHAVAVHADLVARIKAVGAGVKVEPTRPCQDQPDKGLVTITDGTSAERDSVKTILTKTDGFGVPVQLGKD